MKIEFGRFSESDIKDGKIFYVYMNYIKVILKMMKNK